MSILLEVVRARSVRGPSHDPNFVIIWTLTTFPTIAATAKETYNEHTKMMAFVSSSSPELPVPLSFLNPSRIRARDDRENIQRAK